LAGPLDSFAGSRLSASPFDAFVGNRAAVSFLRATLATGRVTHAYLFTGPPHIGKRTLALALAAALVCERAPAASPAGAAGPGAQLSAVPAPCGECRQCRLVAKHTHSDVLLVEAEPGRRGITIEQVRHVEHVAGLRPYEAQRKVLILRNVETMAEPAANALLKTLEEPPGDTVLVLTAADSSHVLPTVASRCREVALRPVPAEEIERALRERGADEAQARLLSRLAAGRPGWAFAAAGDPSWLAAHYARVEALEAALARPPIARLPAAALESTEARAHLDTWLGWWRDALLVQQGCADLVANVDRLQALHCAAAGAGIDCWRAVRRIEETRAQLDANANPRLALEALLLDLPQVPELSAVAASPDGSLQQSPD
jgi:DNA polymerase-3 subunit delta'